MQQQKPTFETSKRYARSKILNLFHAQNPCQRTIRRNLENYIAVHEQDGFIDRAIERYKAIYKLDDYLFELEAED